MPHAVTAAVASSRSVALFLMAGKMQTAEESAPSNVLCVVG